MRGLDRDGADGGVAGPDQRQHHDAEAAAHRDPAYRQAPTGQSVSSVSHRGVSSLASRANRSFIHSCLSISQSVSHLFIEK